MQSDIPYFRSAAPSAFRSRAARRGAMCPTGIAAALAALVLAGCRAVDVGSPSVVRKTRPVENTAESPSRSDVTDVRMTYVVDGSKSVLVGLTADVREEYDRFCHEETTTITSRRRLSYGFFPAAAEQYCVPEGAEPSPCLKRGYPAAFVLGLPFVPLGTIHALLLEGPFGSYDCSKGKSRNAYSHVGLLGVHKYTTTVREGPVAGPVRRETPKVVSRKAVDVPGPFEIEFSIPELKHRPAPAVANRYGSASFPLPVVFRDRTVRAVVSFRPVRSAGNADPFVSRALEKAAAKSHAFDITLRAPEPKPGPKPDPDSGRKPPPPPPPRPFRIVDIKPDDDGRYLVRVEVLDQSQTLDIALRIIQPDVRRMVREDFLSKHSGVLEQHVREFLQYETEKDGRFLVFTGWAFSARPVEDGWNYDPDSRHGWVRLRISGGMPAADAKHWARKNISAIVEEKNVVLEAGRAPPPGATYHSLSEHFEKGILTVEFEAVE